MKIGIIGTGKMGSHLAQRWVAKGHEIMFGSRTPDKAVDLAKQVGKNATGGSMAAAAEFGEVVVLAVPWRAAKEVAAALGSLEGKTLIDITNPLLPEMAGLDTEIGTSAAEQIAEWAEGANVVKAFNTIYFVNLDNPVFGGKRATLFLCGDDQGAKGQVRQLGKDIGLAPVDCGPLWMARHLESLGFIWIYLAFKQGKGTDFVINMQRRK